LIALLFVLARTLVKLYLDRQAGQAGAKFRTKMVIGALSLSLTPVVAMFCFSYLLMNRSLDRWFMQPAQEVNERTAAVASLLIGYAGTNAQTEAESMAASENAGETLRTRNYGYMLEEFRARDKTLQGGFACALYNGREEAVYNAPLPWSELSRRLPLSAAATGRPQPFSIDGVDYVMASTKLGSEGSVMVAMPLPIEYGAALQKLEKSQKKFTELRSQQRLWRRFFMQMQLMITMLVLFVSCWFGLYLSKSVTRPVAALAEATEAISSGRLEVRIREEAGDELGHLVRSFNNMAGELEANRRQINASQQALGEANAQLERRTRYMETILESIPTGVLSLDAMGAVTRINAAFLRMFQIHAAPHAGRLAGMRLQDLFDRETAAELLRMMRQAERMGASTAEMEIACGAATLMVGVTVASMSRPGATTPKMGCVVVFEDLSDMLRAQKQAAWSEVARRVAHEIKNPLTPITLSAERILRRLNKGPIGEESREVIVGGAAAIVNGAETVRRLVDEFSQLARFPQSRPQPCDVNAIVEGALELFTGRLEGIAIRLELSRGLPTVMADPEGLKRIVVNLVDNAAESMQEAMAPELTIATEMLEEREVVELVIADSGHGVSAAAKEKLFQPYFSTKERGTGLGLAIVARIVEEHHGSIRVEENHPVGAKFIIELPVGVKTETA